jgi:hypothetical protein
MLSRCSATGCRPLTIAGPPVGHDMDEADTGTGPVRHSLAGEVQRRIHLPQRTGCLIGQDSPLMTLAGPMADVPIDRCNPTLYDRQLLVTTVYAPRSIGH